MSQWLFQGNPDTFDIDGYLASHRHILWSVNQTHLAEKMRPGDPIFLWRAAGSQREVSGVIAAGEIASAPKEQADTEGAPFWRVPDKSTPTIRVSIDISKVCATPRMVVRADWLKDDPILSDLTIFKLRTNTNYEITITQAKRLAALVANTGRDWTEEEALAGLYAYVKTFQAPISKAPGSTVADVALVIGRAVSGVYNKVMNFRSIDPRDSRSGFSSVASADERVWRKYFDSGTSTLDDRSIVEDYEKVWGLAVLPSSKEPAAEYGETNSGGLTRPQASRQGSDMTEYRAAFTYAVDRAERVLEPRHQHYQVRLRAHLEGRVSDLTWERNFIDVQFLIEGQQFIGEIKVTEPLRIEEAYRMALGQLLEYAYIKFNDVPPAMIMFLDKPLDNARARLANRLGIHVVIEKDATFGVQQSDIAVKHAEIIGRLFPDR